jgi:diguanylate cyclase (GGDEF)-like protein/PAS domain S-box-containing protein
MTRIVVIDDRVTNRNILTRLALSVEEGLQVSAFASPVEAIDALDGGLSCDLIVTDYNMPEMDGAGFVRTLRQRGEHHDVPVIVVTVYEDREFCYRALEAGATDFLLSPVDHLEFRARARNLLTLRRQQRLLADRAAGLEQALTRQETAAGEDVLGRVLDAIPAALSIVDSHGRLVFANQAHEALLGLKRQDALGRPLGETHGEDYALRNGVTDEKVRETGVPLARPRYETIEVPDGQQRTLLTAKAPLANAAGWVKQVLTVSFDVTELRQAEADSVRAARTDQLTGLANAAAFQERSEGELLRARREHRITALLYVDLDRFKGVNDAFGQEFGDGLLRAVGQRLRDRLGDGDALARIQGDEFAILRVGSKRPDDAADLARRLAEAFAEPFLIHGREVHSSASIGITLAPADGRTIDVLLKNAELAMYRAKASGRDTWRFFSAEMNLQARRAVTLERELRQALAGEQFVVYYQPQLDLRTNEIVGLEALIRWNHPRRGLIRPGEFIGLAEEIGLIAPMTAWVLRTACRQHRVWRDKGYGGMQMSVNLSPVQFRERGVELLIERVLKESGLSPAALDIELTENAVIENSTTAAQSLRYLNQLGVTLSIDDFGTGYSSLAYIKRLPVQRLKIDQTFVQNLESSANDDVIVKAIINLGHSLGLKVIAEGVETEGQLARLRRLGCDEVQGNLISPPISAEALEERLAVEQRPKVAASG